MPLRSIPTTPEVSSTPTDDATTSILNSSEARKFMVMGIDADIHHQGMALVKAMDELKRYLTSHNNTVTMVDWQSRMSQVMDGIAGIDKTIETRDQWRRQG